MEELKKDEVEVNAHQMTEKKKQVDMDEMNKNEGTLNKNETEKDRGQVDMDVLNLDAELVDENEAQASKDEMHKDAEQVEKVEMRWNQDELTRDAEQVNKGEVQESKDEMNKEEEQVYTNEMAKNDEEVNANEMNKDEEQINAGYTEETSAKYKNKEKDPSTSNFVRLRGLPFSAREDDIKDFLHGLEVKSVTFTLTSSGRASGECYVELENKAAAEEAKHFDKQEMKKRYIEVFIVSESEVVWLTRHNIIRKGDQNTPYNFVVKLRGLPFSAGESEIKEFFSGLEVADVVIDKEPGGRPSGEAFVRFASKQDAEMALERNRNNMGSRYVEVFRSSGDELEKSKASRASRILSLRSITAERSYPVNRSEPVPLRFANAAKLGMPTYRREEYGGPMRSMNVSRTRGTPYEVPYRRHPRVEDYNHDEDYRYDDLMKIYMRGLPYNVSAYDIENFFAPLNCVEIDLGFNERRRPSGDACVIFGTIAEARDALNRNKRCIGNRYIELFAAPSAPPFQKYITFRKIGGTGSYMPITSGSSAAVSRPPVSLNRINYGGSNDWADNGATDGRYSVVGQNKPVSHSRMGYMASDAVETCGVQTWSDREPVRNYGAGYGTEVGYNVNYATGAQQCYNNEYEGKQTSSYEYQWNASAASTKTNW